MDEGKNYYSPAQKRAQQKYQREKLSQVRFWVKKEEKLAIQQEAEAHGLSMKRFIAQAINTMAGREIVSCAEIEDEADES